MRFIDAFLNRLTLYGLALYYLIFLVAAGIVFAFLGFLPYDPLQMVITAAVLYGASKALNPFLGKLFRTRPNWESSAITALILALIVGPLVPLSRLWLLVIIAAIAQVSKYVLVFNKRHIFNPAALGVLVSAIVFDFGASWWVGNLPMVPLVLVGGFLILRKARWFHLSLPFLLVYMFSSSLLVWYRNPGADILGFLSGILLYSPIIFFSLVMLTEPMTTPSGNRERALYGSLTALVYVLLPIVMSVSYGLELSLLVGNIVGLILFGNVRRQLKFLGREIFAKNSEVFTFVPSKPLSFIPGQYLLWTLPHDKTDSRGHRRYFTIASSPTEKYISIITKFAEKSSSFKLRLKQLKQGDSVSVLGPDGNFILPKDSKQLCVFIAGGIGIAPFRSMVKYLLDEKRSQPIVLFYSNNTVEEIGFKDLFDEAQKILGMKTVYTLTGTASVPAGWQGRIGFVDAEMVKAEVGDYKQALFYVSGPDPMVRAMKKILLGLGVHGRKIKTDYFSGYAT